MDIKTCYDTIGADYDDVLKRFMSEARVKKFAGMFLRDTSYDLLKESMEKKDYPTAFRAIHTLKGVAMNLALTKLASASSDLTEALRGGEPKGDVDALYAAVAEEYQVTRTAIEAVE